MARRSIAITLIGGKGGINNLYGDGDTAGGGPVSGGNDRLVSPSSTTDNMWGDFDSPHGSATFGHDTFVFGPKNGDDIINDFHQGEDVIEIHHTPIPEQALAQIPPGH